MTPRRLIIVRRVRAILSVAITVGVSWGIAPSHGAIAAESIVDIVNASRATACAEEDNVYVTLAGAGIAGFAIAAVLPSYIDRLSSDSTAPDFAGCEMGSDPSYPFTPRTLTLFEDERIRLVGHTFASFWRPEVVPLVVDGHEQAGLHLVQLFLKSDDRGAVEFLVLYPSDGYWRLKTLPPPHLADNAYGSSFLIGPIIEQGRPLVRLESVSFHPRDLRFDLAFADGGAGSLRVTGINAKRAEVEVALQPPLPADRPFAALRSMFVTPADCDVAEVDWQPANGVPRQMAPIMALDFARAVEVIFGRREISRHNASAPELIFRNFVRETNGE